jgi:MscS family membrane protein
MAGHTWLEDLIDLHALGVPAVWAPWVGGLVHAVLIGGVLGVALRFAERVLAVRGAGALSAAVGTLRRPLPRVGVWLGALETVRGLPIPERLRGATEATLASCALLMVASATLHAGAVGLVARAGEPDAPRWLRPHTVPMGVLLWRVLAGSLAAYGLARTWALDLTGWLASAGVLGIAVGFAAQETVSNLFAGFFILADRPYRVGDLVALEDGTKGRVLDIGIRSTRIRSVDGAVVVLPNHKMASGRIVNLTAEEGSCTRVSITVQVAYDADLQLVRRVLLEAIHGLPELANDGPEHAPTVRLQALADSGITVVIHAFSKPEDRDALLDGMISATVTALAREGVRIPFPTVEVQLPQEGSTG